MLGMTLHRSHAMNGYAGLILLRSQRQENIILSEHVMNLSMESADLVAGPVVFIVEIITPRQVQFSFGILK